MFARIRSLIVKELYAVLLDPKTRFQVFVGHYEIGRASCRERV